MNKPQLKWLNGFYQREKKEWATILSKTTNLIGRISFITE